MKPLIIFNPHGCVIEEKIIYRYRDATRGVVFDNDNKVATLFKNNKYYSLPGGGTHEGEYSHDAFKRECKEELGCNICELNHLGTTIEFFEEWSNLTNIFIARVEGSKEIVELVGDEDEDEKACAVNWIDFEELKGIVSGLTKNGEENKRFRYERDLSILKMCNNQ